MPSSARKLDKTNGSAQMELVGGSRRRAPAAKLLRIERPPLGDDRVWEKELRALPAHLLGALPRPTTLRLEVPGCGGIVAIATSAERAEAERTAGAIVFDAAEWSALVTAAESERLWPADLRELCARKTRAAGWALDLETALAGARPDAPAGWTLGRVLDRVGAHLLSADC